MSEINGLAATQSKILFTTQNQPNVYQVNAGGGSCTVFAVLPTPMPHGAVWEEYIAISPGVGGFAAGDIYVTQFEKVFKISPDGSTVTLFATIPAFSNHDFFHSGITFDTSGNYGNKMIVTGQNFLDGHGQVYTIDSTGTATKLADVGGSGGLGIAEGPVITLGSFTPAPGRLLVSQEDINQVWLVNPNGSTVSFNTSFDVADLAVIPAQLCPLVSSGGSFFITDFDNARILQYPASDFTPAGGVLLPVEFDTPGFSILLVNNSGAQSVFDPNQIVGPGTMPIVHEASTFVACNAGTACPMSPGFWKKHAFPAALTFPVSIGGISYSQADFVSILDNPGGGNAVQILGFQLVAALINTAAGATIPANVASTIAHAESLLNGINLLSGFVAPSSAPGQQMIADAGVLDTFNNTPCSRP